MATNDNAAARPASVLWIMLLTLAATATTLALACATPFTALAALAATQMRARDGIALMLASWAASQAVGFCLLDYPRDPTTIALGAALGSAAVLCAVAARQAVARVGTGEVLRIALAYLVAAIVFKAVLFVWSLGLGGTDIALSPAIAGRQLVRNGAILIGLYVAYRGLVAAGVPAATRRRAALA